jgi:hypothetical protein
MIDIRIISSSLFLIFVLLLSYYLIGRFINYIINNAFRKKFDFSIFKAIFYGILTVVYFYALVKSSSLLNSVTITGIPILIILYERNKSIHLQSSENSIGINVKSILLVFLSFSLFYAAKYSFHFSSEIHTGYSDQAFYHAIASSLRLTGVETINIHTGALKLVPGMIYHYWDLWFLAFHYDFLSIINNFGLFINLNQFEINTLVFQPSLFIVIYFGLLEISMNFSRRIIKKNDFKIGIAIFIAFLASLHTFLEFGIIHHPKQFIIGSLFLFFLLELSENVSNQFRFIYFYPALLFYYPLPGSVLIATCFIFSINWKSITKNFISKKFYLQIIIIALTLFSFICYYFFLAKSCMPKVYTINKSSWDLISVISRILFYHGYHTLFSPLGIIIMLNSIIIYFIYKKKSMTILDSFSIISPLIIFSYLNIIIGHLVSALLYTLPEDFQFYNNDYFFVSIFLIFDFILIYNYFKDRLIYYFSFLVLCGFYFLINTFYNKPSFYFGVSIPYPNYNRIKNKKFMSVSNSAISDSLPSLYSASDIIYSIYNTFPKHDVNLCEGK